jgi:hypothetical protein
MIKRYALAGLITVLNGCAAPAVSWKGTVKWPESDQDEQSVKTIIAPVEAGASLAAAAAIRELLRTNTDPGLFWGCSSPEQGLDVAVFTGPTPGLYYVVLDEHFSRCGGPRGRVLDWHYVYAVTPQGQVVAKAPPPRGEPPNPAPPATEPAPAAPPPAEPPPTPPVPAPAQPPAPSIPSTVPGTPP